MGSAKPARSLGSTPVTAAQTRTIEAALVLFARHGVSGTSLQMIANAVGVTKAAIYHQYNTKDEIIRAVAEVVLARLESAVTAAEAERSRARARQVLIAAMIDLAVERRHMASVLQRDPVMLHFLEQHAPFRRVMARVNRVLMGGASDPKARVQAATIAAAIAGAVIHPLVLDLEDESVRAQLLTQVRKLLPYAANDAAPAGQPTTASVLQKSGYGRDGTAVAVSRRGRGGRTPRRPRPPRARADSGRSGSSANRT